jgi:hypothetical protein
LAAPKGVSRPSPYGPTRKYTIRIHKDASWSPDLTALIAQEAERSGLQVKTRVGKLGTSFSVAKPEFYNKPAGTPRKPKSAEQIEKALMRLMKDLQAVKGDAQTLNSIAHTAGLSKEQIAAMVSSDS